MIWAVVAAAIGLLAALPAAAQQPRPRLITELSQSRIDISYRFAGAELLVFGALFEPPARRAAGRPDIVVVIRGPSRPLVVRQRERVAGIWINTRAFRYASAPTFYALASTRPITEMMSEREAAIWELGLAQLQLSPATAADPAEDRLFQEGLSAQRRARGLYVEQPFGVRLTAETLYRARLALPSEVPEGDYRVDVFLVRHGEVRAQSSTPLIVEKSGFEQRILRFSREAPVAYGLVAVALAMTLGMASGLALARRIASV